MNETAKRSRFFAHATPEFIAAQRREMPHLAEVTNSQKGWRFDLVVLEAENSIDKAAIGAREPSDANTL